MSTSEHPPSGAPARALREAHAHIASHGRALTMPDLSACASVAECLDVLARERARAGGPTAWVLAHGARAESWREARWPTLAELDRAVPDRPCAVMSFDHHAVVANSMALAAAGIASASGDEPGGVVCRDAHTGAPTGLLLERSAHRVWNLAPDPGPDERRAHVLAALQDLASHGYVEVHDMLAQPWLGPLLAELHDSGRLPAHVELYVPLDDLESAVLGAPAWQRPGVRLAGGKIFTDGTLNSRTAWMLQPYRDPMPGMDRGKPLMTVDEIATAIERCALHGLQLAAHAIGDGAVRACLDAAERASGHQGAKAPTGRGPSSSMPGCPDASMPLLRIEHLELVDAADVHRFAALGVTASVQPCHLLYDIEALRRYLPHRLERVLPLRDLIDSGLAPGRTLLFGSDVPIVRPHPEDSVLAATSRRRTAMSPSDAIAPEQSISETRAWAALIKA